MIVCEEKKAGVCTRPEQRLYSMWNLDVKIKDSKAFFFFKGFGVKKNNQKKLKSNHLPFG